MRVVRQLGGTLVWIGLVGLGSAAAGADEPPVNLVRGPYLQMTTRTGTILRWRTDEPAASRVRFGRELSVLEGEAGDMDLTTEHRVELTGLLPGTRYYYAVGDESKELAGGPDFHFTTNPASPKPTRIWAIGDSGTAAAGDFGSWLVRDAYLQLAGDRETDVWLMLGDNAYYYGTDAEYQAAVFDTYTSLLRQTAVWSTIGNHETYAPLPDGRLSYFDIFDCPTQGQGGGVPSGTERYYSFDYGNIHFVCLDSELSVRDSEQAMVEWLGADLGANTNEWVIAFWHSPPYTKGSHDSDNLFDNAGNMTQMRRKINPILEAYGVDLVLSGHSHNYERSHLLHGHYGFSWELEPGMVLDSASGDPADGGAYQKLDEGPYAGQGTVYVVAGSSGWATFQTGRHPVMHRALLNRGSLVIDVDGRRLDLRYLRETGAVDDQFTMIKGGEVGPLRFTTVRAAGGVVTARWRSAPGQTYRVEKSVAAHGSEWVTASENIVATGYTSAWEDLVGPEGSRCFYRVVRVP